MSKWKDEIKIEKCKTSNETRLAQRRVVCLAKKDESVAFTGRNKFVRVQDSQLSEV